MKQKLILMITLLVALLLLIAACEPAAPNDPNSLPQVNVDDYATTTTISDLLELDGSQVCTWDSPAITGFGVEATQGDFIISDGSYYFENFVAGMTQDRPDGGHYYTYFDGERFYSWNTNQLQAPGKPPLGQDLGLTTYENSVVNDIGYRAHFGMLENVDYNIVCRGYTEELPALEDLETVPEGIVWIALG